MGKPCLLGLLVVILRAHESIHDIENALFRASLLTAQAAKPEWVLSSQGSTESGEIGMLTWNVWTWGIKIQEGSQRGPQPQKKFVNTLQAKACQMGRAIYFLNSNIS